MKHLRAAGKGRDKHNPVTPRGFTQQCFDICSPHGPILPQPPGREEDPRRIPGHRLKAEVMPGWAGSQLSRAAAQPQALLTVQGRAGPTNTALLTQQHGTNAPSSPQRKSHPSQPKTSRREELQETPSSAGDRFILPLLAQGPEGSPGTV